MDFIIDTGGEGNDDLLENSPKDSETRSIMTQLLKDFNNSLNAKVRKQKPPTKKLSKDEVATKSVLVDFGWKDKLSNSPKTTKKTVATLNKLIDTKETKQNVKAVLEKSDVLKPDFGSLHEVPRYDVSQKKLKEERKKEREKTKGDKWYGLSAPEMTDEIKRDLEIIQMRSVLDPKRFYKKNDMNVLPKYFQIGKILDSPVEYYSNRVTKKERKKTLVDDLMANAEFSKYNKRKYKEIIEEKQKTHYKAWRQAKKLKKKKH